MRKVASVSAYANLQLRPALVVDDNDPDRNSRVQVRIFPELKDVLDRDLPWAEPRMEGFGRASGHGTHLPPEIDSWVLVEVNDTWTSFFYTRDAFLSGFTQYSNLPNLPEVGTQSHPQPRFILFKDGSVHFVNTDTGEHGIVSSTGAYIVMTSSGTVSINGNLTVDL